MEIPEHIKQIYQNSECLFSKQDVENALDKMAHDIHETVAHQNPLLLCTMIGGLVPTGNLLPRLDFPLELNYIHATRYQGNTCGGDVAWKVCPDQELKGRTIVVIDDILDGGLTLQAIIEYCYACDAKKVYTAVLVDKLTKRLEGGLAKADFSALQVDDRYVFGYGMDYKNYFRNAPGIFVVPKQYE